MVRFDMPRAKTNNARGARTVRIKTTRAEKKGFTVALAATASGVKLPAFIILKERNGVLGSRVAINLSVPRNVTLHASLNGWMNADLLKVWLRRDFKSEEQNRLLILDQYRPHASTETADILSAECNTARVMIPGGCTSIVQPMDRSVDKPFKDSIKASWSQWMKTGAGKTRHGNLKQPSRQNVIDWVSKAWAGISPDFLIKAFLVCGISNALDGTQDSLIDNSIPVDEGSDDSDDESDGVGTDDGHDNSEDEDSDVENSDDAYA